MNANNYFYFILIGLVLMAGVLSFEIKRCTTSSMAVAVNSIANFGCTSTTYFGYCTLVKLDDPKQVIKIKCKKYNRQRVFEYRTSHIFEY